MHEYDKNDNNVLPNPRNILQRVKAMFDNPKLSEMDLTRLVCFSLLFAAFVAAVVVL